MQFFKNFDWDWFGKKAKKRAEEAERKLVVVQRLVETRVESRPFFKGLYVNGIITVILHSGEAVSATRTPQDVEKLRTLNTEQEVRDLLSDVPEVIEDDTEDDRQNIEQLSKYEDEVLELLGEDFSYSGGNFLYKNIGVPIPSLVLNTLIEHKKADDEKSFNSVRMFFLKLANAFNTRNRENVMAFIKNNDVRLTPTGNIIGYRRVVSIPNPVVKNYTEEFVSFVNTQYTKVKKNKKSPKKYFVMLSEDGGYKLAKPNINLHWEEEEDILGTLQDLKIKIDTVVEQPKQLYTSYHNHGKHTFGIGDIYSLPDEAAVDSDRLCSASKGAHFASCDYNYSGFGDEKIVVLVNPSATTVVPAYDSGKARTIEMKIACINPNDEGVHIDMSLIEQADKEYNDYTIEQIEEALKNRTFESAASDITPLDLETIKKSLQEKVVKL